MIRYSLILVLLITGCATKKVAMPPPIPNFSRSLLVEQTDAQIQAQAAPQPPKTISLMWDKGEPTALTYIYSTSNISIPVESWVKVGETPGNTITLPATKQQEYFAIRNFLNGEYSDWARK